MDGIDTTKQYVMIMEKVAEEYAKQFTIGEYPNLFKEIKDVLEDHRLTINDIVAVRGYDKSFDVEAFLDMAKHIWYDDGYGHQMINKWLVIQGNGWWLERREYDGMEWFEYCEVPTIPEKVVAPSLNNIIDARLDNVCDAENTLKRVTTYKERMSRRTYERNLMAELCKGEDDE